MPAFSTGVDEEGVLFDNWLLVATGELRETETRSCSPRPVSLPDPDANLADLRAQIAANEKGVAELRRMVEQFGLDVVTAYMGHVQDNAEESVRRIIAELHDGAYRYETDSGAVIEVALPWTSRPDRADRLHRHLSPAARQLQRADVRGDGRGPVRPPHPGRRRHPAQQRLPQAGPGHHPAGLLLAPAYPAAVVAGNVETSQAVTGALYAALGVKAEGSGTMNNVTFGNDRVPVLRDGGQRLGRRRRLRRRRRRPDPHDQLPADRPRSARMALPGPSRQPSRSARAAAAPAVAGWLRRRRRLRFLDPMTVAR